MDRRTLTAIRGMAHHRGVVSIEIDLAYVAELLRGRRRVLQPEAVGLPRGRRRRTPGLRREEVAALCLMSAAYYSRLERRRVERHCGPRPSPAMLAGIARGLRFSRAERDRLFNAAGYGNADPVAASAHLEPGLMHVLDRLADTPALAIGSLGQVLRQTPSATVLFGELTHYTGWGRSGYYRWFTCDAERRYFTAGEQSKIGIEIAADLRGNLERTQPDCTASDLTRILLRRSSEFTDLWRCTAPSSSILAVRQCRVVHPELGGIDLQREVLLDDDSGQRLVIYLAIPGSASHAALKLATVIGHQRFDG